MRHRAPARTASSAWRVLAAALALACALSMVLWADRSSQRDARPSSGPRGVSADPADPADPAAPLGVSADVPATAPTPVRVTIPGIDVDSALLRLGKQSNGEVEVPEDPLLAGWYALGTPPGSVGSAVILGHVDSVDGPAVFHRLRELKAGDRVEVDLADGASAVFVVRSVRAYANADFPARLVYTSHGRRELNLITCGGAYDASRGGYQANLVVNARWVGGART